MKEDTGVKEAELDALREPHKSIHVLTEKEANREAYEEEDRGTYELHGGYR